MISQKLLKDLQFKLVDDLTEMLEQVNYRIEALLSRDGASIFNTSSFAQRSYDEVLSLKHIEKVAGDLINNLKESSVDGLDPAEVANQLHSRLLTMIGRKFKNDGRDKGETIEIEAEFVVYHAVWVVYRKDAAFAELSFLM